MGSQNSCVPFFLSRGPATTFCARAGLRGKAGRRPERSRQSLVSQKFSASDHQPTYAVRDNDPQPIHDRIFTCMSIKFLPAFSHRKLPLEGEVTIPSVTLFLQEAELMRSCESPFVLKVMGLGLLPEAVVAAKPIFGGPSKKQIPAAVRGATPLEDLPVASAYEHLTPFEIVCEAKKNSEMCHKKD